MTNEERPGGIFWLASYPKSGNTWTRSFIANLTHEEETAVDINELYTGSIASGQHWVEEALGIEIDELSQDEIDRLRPDAYRWIAENQTDPGYHKIHDAYTYLADEEPLIPPEATRGALCIVRNPLDVAISFAHHSHISIDKSIEHMGRSNYAFCARSDRMHNQLRQWLLSWSGHVRSWLDAPGIDRLVVRYEDMQQQPLQTFSAVARFLKLPADQASVSGALEHCAMEKLQQQEAEKGFKEKMSRARSFFRKGIAGDWIETLDKQQVTQIVNDHHEMMAQLGYLDDQGEPLQQIVSRTPWRC